jgi:nitronate monooxygenase
VGPAEWNTRTLPNSFTEKWSRDPAGLKASLEQEQARFLAARDAGDTDVAPVIVGEGAGLVRGVLPAAEIVRTMVAQAEKSLREASELLVKDS